VAKKGKPGDVTIYRAPGGEVDVRVAGDTVWLNQGQMVRLFGRDQSVVARHILNVFREKELPREGNMQNLHLASSHKPVGFYSLDVIISVGYRVKSPEGVRFRQWATRILREHLTRGYTIQKQRFEQNARELEAALAMMRRVASSDALTSDQGRGLVDVIARYTQTFILLQRFDEGLLTEPKGSPGGELRSHTEALHLIAEVKTSLMERREASVLFGQERDKGLASILGNLDQSVFGEPAYPSVESKAAHLLYFVIKNHPFSDGNKRIASLLFVDFLNRNGRLLKDGAPVINDMGLAALALLVAESNPKDKDMMIRLIINMLTGAT
jgi:prophage maintenance system killer protein